jgi:hypothetical protein
MAGQHDNFFRAFAHHRDYHEDPLSRAAVLVMRLVPLAYQCFLDLATRDDPDCHESLAKLPRGSFSVQRTPEGDSAERLLSVFLTPEGESPDSPVPVHIGPRADGRGVRHDGFIQHDGELIVVIEAKREDRHGWEQAEYPGELDIEEGGAGTVRFISWSELVDQWVRLMEEPSLVGHAESELISNFLDLVSENPQINARSSLERCRRLRVPLSRRLQFILSQALERPADLRQGDSPGGQVDGFSGPASLLALCLYEREGRETEIRLQMWAAVTAGEAHEFYRDPDRLRRIAAIVNTFGRGGGWKWAVWTDLSLKTRRSEQNRVGLSGSEDDLEERFARTAALADQLNCMVPREDVAEYLKPFLDVGLATREEASAALSKMNDFDYSSWRVVATTNVICLWPLGLAEKLDSSDNPRENRFILEARDAARQLTELLGVSVVERDGAN